MIFNNIFNQKYTSWLELETAIESIEIAKEKGTAFEQFVFCYFTYFKDIYLISDLYMESDIPAELRKQLKLEKYDSGVDGLIIKDNNSSVAYQAKFRSGNVAPSYEDLTSFWAESEHATERCIFANCYELPQQAYKKKRQFMILRNELTSLGKEFFDWLYSFATAGIQSTNIIKYNPLPHQIKMISDVCEGFITEKRGKMLAACGTGKTLTALWIKEKIGANTVLFVAPNLALIKQTLEAWMPQASNPFTYLCVCSDNTVAQNTNQNENDEFQTDSSYIGVPVTTDPEKIIEFIRFDTTKDKIIFSTYQSLDAIVSALGKMDDFKFELIFFDEAHRTAGNKDTQMFIIGMNDEFISAEKRLFMTATERFVNPRIIGRAHEYKYEIFSMDNYEQYGPTFTSLPFREAIEQEIISDYKIVLCCMKEGELKSIIDANLILNIGNQEIESQNLFKQVLLAKVMRDINIHKAISYHKNIDSAKLFIVSPSGVNLSDVVANVVDSIDISDVYTDHINGTMSAGVRTKIFDEFIASPYGVISNARCLTEGVDVPIIDAVYFADPKNSVIDIIQAVGRSLRKVKDNPQKISYIIIPIIVSDEVTNFEEINPENFSTLHTVVQALRDQDRILADYVDKLNLKLATGKTPVFKGDDIIPLVIEVTEQLDIDDIADQILLRVAEVNKDPVNFSREFIFTPESRTSGVKRGSFKTVGDYNLNSFLGSCIIPTLNKYASMDVGLQRTDIKINHNNVSHTKKIGAIEEKDGKFNVTNIGRAFYECTSYEAARPIFQEQILKFFERSPIGGLIYFPYRFALRALATVGRLSKFEFAYSLFIAKDLGDRGVTEVSNRISYLRTTYPKIEVLNEVNKSIVLDALNNKYDTTLKFDDIWSSRTTLSNQFNYLKNHLMSLPEVIVSEPDDIVLQPDAQCTIFNLLEKTHEIETCPMDKLSTYFTTYNKWLQS